MSLNFAQHNRSTSQTDVTPKYIGISAYWLPRRYLHILSCLTVYMRRVYVYYSFGVSQILPKSNNNLLIFSNMNLLQNIAFLNEFKYVRENSNRRLNRAQRVDKDGSASDLRSLPSSCLHWFNRYFQIDKNQIKIWYSFRFRVTNYPANPDKLYINNMTENPGCRWCATC